MLKMINTGKIFLATSGILTGMVMASAGLAAGVTDNMPLGRSPVAIVDGQYPTSYFPNTELLGADEMRITALGTGMPNQTKAAVSISYLVELGNGDKFLFDIGSGSLGNLFALRPDGHQRYQGNHQSAYGNCG